MFYKPFYGEKWPSIRLALLTSKKYCALVNGVAGNMGSIEDKLKTLGAFDIIDKASDTWIDKTVDENGSQKLQSVNSERSTFTTSEINNSDIPNISKMRSKAQHTCTSLESESELEEAEEVEETEEETLPSYLQFEKNTSLDNFVPTRELYSDKLVQEQQTIAANTLDLNPSVHVNIDDAKNKGKLPINLKAYSYPKGTAGVFPKPKSKNPNKKIGMFFILNFMKFINSVDEFIMNSIKNII